jgi:hypothetical protein
MSTPFNFLNPAGELAGTKAFGSGGPPQSGYYCVKIDRIESTDNPASGKMILTIPAVAEFNQAGHDGAVWAWWNNTVANPGTVLFLGASEIQPFVSAAGQFLYNISYAFSYRPDGHDRIYNSAVDDGVSRDESGILTPFRKVVRSASAKRSSGSWKGLLDEADFTTLFQLT